MSEFEKAKVGFVLALLGAVFATSTLLQPHMAAGFELAGIRITLGQAYGLFAGLLSLSVYLFALDYITQQPTAAARQAGNWSYVAALSLPPLYLLGELVSWSTASLAPLAQENRVVQITLIVLGTAVALAVLLWTSTRLAQLLLQLERRSLANLEEEQGRSAIASSETWMRASIPSPTVLAAHRAVEHTLRASLLRAGRSSSQREPMINLVKDAGESGLLPEQRRSSLENLVSTRNKIVHGAFEPEVAHADWLYGEARLLIDGLLAAAEAREEPAQAHG